MATRKLCVQHFSLNIIGYELVIDKRKATLLVVVSEV